MTIPSPCIRNCCLDSQEVCLGCFRTLQEITQWSYLDDVEKQTVVTRAEQRKQEHEKQFGQWKR